MRLEYLEKDLEKYFKIKQMSGPRNVTEARVDYKDLYNKNTIQIIADWYRKDIDYWNFDFDTPARSNIWNID